MARSRESRILQQAEEEAFYRKYIRSNVKYRKIAELRSPASEVLEDEGIAKGATRT